MQFSIEPSESMATLQCCIWVDKVERFYLATCIRLAIYTEKTGCTSKKLDTMLTASLLNVTVTDIALLWFLFNWWFKRFWYRRMQDEISSSRTTDVFSSGANQSVKAFSLVGLLDWV